MPAMLAARGGRPQAFDRHCIQPDDVAPRRMPACAARAAVLVVASLAIAGAQGSAAATTAGAAARGQASAPAAPAPDAKPIIAPRAGPSGTEVSISWSQLVPNTPVQIGFGGLGSGFEILDEVVTDANGDFSTVVRVPGWPEEDSSYLFFTAYADGRPTAFSAPFHVTGADGRVRVEGRITGEGTECTAMRGEDDELFTLTGDLGSVAVGDRVVVEGTATEPSACAQGLTIAVTSIVAG